MEQTPMRAAPLTAERLDDLTELVAVADENIAYLAPTLTEYPKGGRTHTTLKERHDKLVRAREWLARKIAAEQPRKTHQETAP